jgi:hypothetical protein
MRLLILITNILLISTNLVFAETIVGYEYYIQPIQKEAIADSKIMAGSIEEKERWTKLSRPAISPTMDTYAKSGKVKKVIVKQIEDKRPNGVTAIFTVKEGEVPSDYNYSTIEDRKKEVEEEYQRRMELLREIEMQKIRDEKGY